MKLEAIKRNAINEIAHQQSLAADGSTVVIIQCERMIALVDEIAPQITPEEWAKIKSGVLGIAPSAEWRASVKPIKERLELSWNEIEMLRNAE